MKAKPKKLAVVMLVLSIVTSGTVAALNFSADAPNPMMKVDSATVSSYDVKWGDSLKFENDSGSVQALPATLNKSTDVDDLGTGTVNPFSLVATNIEESDFGEFPRTGDSTEDEDNTASALDASEWTKSGANSSKLNVSDTQTAQNVEAVRFDANAMASGDTATATYGNWTSELDSDESKRYLQVGADVDQLTSGTEVLIRVVDESGDYKQIVINSSKTQSSSNVLANATGEGHVSQVQLGELTTYGGGTWDNIEKVEVTVNDGDADVSVSLLNAEKMSRYKFGTQYVQTDDDDDLEKKTIYEPHGTYSVYSVETLDSEFNDATVHDLSFPAHFRAQDLEDSNVKTEFENGKDAGYPNWDTFATIFYRLTLPSAYDLSYSGVELVQTTQWPGDRYVGVQYAEGVSDDTEFEDIEDTQYTSKTSSYDANDKDITVDSTIAPGDDLVLKFEMVFTDGEASDLQSAGDGRSGGGAMGGGLSNLPLIGGLIVVLLGIVRKIGG